MTTTKLTGLSVLQTAALIQAQEEALLGEDVIVTRTTATFPWDAATTHADLLDLKENLAHRHGSRQHPVASLHAVIRKAAKAAKES